MIVHINHISQTKKKTGKPSQLGELVSLVTGSLVDFVEDGVLDASLAPSLRIHLDWIQYRTNFRDPVIVRRTTDSHGKPMSLAEIAIDLRQADPAQLVAAARPRTEERRPDGGRRRRPRVPGRFPAVPRLHDLGLQPPVLAAPGRVGSGVGPRLRGGAAERQVRREPSRSGRRFGHRILGAPQEARATADSCRPKFPRSKSASAPARARRPGWTASRRSTSSRAPATTPSSSSSSATTRRPRSNAP